MSKKVVLSSLDKKCLMKFFLNDIKLFNLHGTKNMKSLGTEKVYELLIEIAEEEPEVLKINSLDEDNFNILFDESGKFDYKPLFIMKNGREEQFQEACEDGDEEIEDIG